MNNPLISVILPIYNVAGYLDKCIESVVSQTYTNLEIILVDDGSPDKCPEICDSWAKKDSRIRVIHKQNAGLSSARNAGLDICTGEYVSFIDSDDWVEYNMYEEQVKYLQDADVVACQIYYVKGESRQPSHDNEKIYVLDDYFDIINSLLSQADPDLRWEVWNKLIRRSSIDDLRFKEGQIFEDIYFNRILMSRVKKVIVYNKPLYNYRVVRPGAINSKFNPKGLSKIDELDEYIKILFKAGKTKEEKNYLEYTLDTIMGFSIQALQSNASKDIHRILNEKFDFYYQEYLSRGGEKKIKFTLYKLSPRLFSSVQRFYVNVVG